MGGAIDTHAHLTEPRLLRRLEVVLDRAWAAGVSGIVVVGWNVDTSAHAVRLAQGHPRLWASVGLHPHDVQAEWGADTRRRLRELVRSPRVVAVGETGLDFHRDLSPRPAQLEALRWHLELAKERGLPAILHCRAAQEHLLTVIEGSDHLSLIWHCFEGTREQADRAVALGFHLGIGGLITYPGQESLRGALAGLPRERLLLETDAPYLSPAPYRSRPNEPANVVAIGRCAAHLRAESADALIEATARTSCRVLSLELPDA